MQLEIISTFALTPCKRICALYCTLQILSVFREKLTCLGKSLEYRVIADSHPECLYITINFV